MIIPELKQKMQAIQEQINAIQAKCVHPEEAVVSTPGSSVGNYDNFDEYWIDHHCKLCDKTWKEDQ